MRHRLGTFLHTTRPFNAAQITVGGYAAWWVATATRMRRVIRHGLLCLAWPLTALAQIDVNTASADDLATIRGIGPATSARIVQERQQQVFQDWADFVHRMRGVGPATAATMSEGGLRVSGQAWTLDTPRSASGRHTRDAEIVWQPMMPRPVEPIRPGGAQSPHVPTAPQMPRLSRPPQQPSSPTNR